MHLGGIEGCVYCCGLGKGKVMVMVMVTVTVTVMVKVTFTFKVKVEVDVEVTGWGWDQRRGRARARRASSGSTRHRIVEGIVGIAPCHGPCITQWLSCHSLYVRAAIDPSASCHGS